MSRYQGGVCVVCSLTLAIWEEARAVVGNVLLSAVVYYRGVTRGDNAHIAVQEEGESPPSTRRSRPSQNDDPSLCASP